MTPDRKISANRENAKKSTGPRTRAGKAKASRNALRHGLGAASFGDPGISARVERIAKMICQDMADDPLVYEQAVIVAQSHVQVARVRAARADMIERYRKRSRLKSSLIGLPSPEETEGVLRNLAMGSVRNSGRRILGLANQFKVTAIKLGAEVDQLVAGKSLTEASMIHRLRVASYTSVATIRDDAECLRLALPELLTLERYERRALSRRRRAIRSLDALRELRRNSRLTNP